MLVSQHVPATVVCYSSPSERCKMNTVATLYLNPSLDVIFQSQRSKHVKHRPKIPFSTNSSPIPQTLLGPVFPHEQSSHHVMKLSEGNLPRNGPRQNSCK